MAFALTLGVACKKDAVVQPEAKPLKIEKKALVDEQAKEHTSACKERGTAGGYTCPGPDFCSPPK